MVSRTLFIGALALLANGCSAAEDRDLQINLCAAYDIVVPRIADGGDSCACNYRKIKCGFDKICNLDDVCASLVMDIDFDEVGQESITYTSSYTKTFEDVVLTLDVTSDPASDGIQGCTATHGEETCDCAACAEGGGVEISCSVGSTGGCTQIDVGNFERFVLFLDTTSTKTITGVQAESGSSVVATTGVAAVAATFALALAL